MSATVLTFVVAALAILGAGAYVLMQQNSPIADEPSNTMPSDVSAQPAASQPTGSSAQGGRTEGVSGDFRYSDMHILPGRFYVSGEQSPPENEEPFIVFPDGNATVQMFGIDTAAPIGDSCNWVVRATIEISGRRPATVDGIETDVANLISITTKTAPEKVCLTN